MRRPSLRPWLDQFAEDSEEPLLAADGLDDALIGVTAYQPGRPVCAVYDYEKCIAALRKQHKWSYEDAVEFMEFNVVGAWVGDQTPIFLVVPDREAVVEAAASRKGARNGLE